MVRCREHPHNHPIYVVDTDLGSSIFFNDFCDEISEEKVQEIVQPTTKKCGTTDHKVEDRGVWKMFFDGACSKEGVRAGVWIKSPDEVISFHSFKLMFSCTNNVAEYEASLLH